MAHSLKLHFKFGELKETWLLTPTHTDILFKLLSTLMTHGHFRTYLLIIKILIGAELMVICS